MQRKDTVKMRFTHLNATLILSKDDLFAHFTDQR